MPLFEDLAVLGAQELIYTLFLPFILIFALLFGALQLVNLFGKKINLVLALVLTLFTMATPVFTWFSTMLPLYGATAAFGVFVAVFIIGTLLVGWRKGKNIYRRTMAKEKKIEELGKQIAELRRKMDAEGDENKKRALWEQISQLKKEQEFIQASE